MRQLMLLLAAICAPVSLLNAKDVSEYPEPEGESVTVRKLVETALAKGDREGMLAAIADLKEQIPASSPIADELFAVVAETNASLESRELTTRLQRVADMLAFVPLGEAKLPEGFPTYTPVGMIERKCYPKQRLAVAQRFMTLFSHISTNGIAMTAPVQKEYTVSEDGIPQQQSMAFFYASPETGQSGKRGSVNVVDKEPVEVVALGIRGSVTPQVIRDAQARLEQWVSTQREYETNGPLRIMGYNSPMVPRKNQFHEIQIPLKKVDMAATP